MYSIVQVLKCCFLSECTLDVSRPGSLNYSMVWKEVVILSVRIGSVQFIDDLEMFSDADPCLLLDSDCRTPMY